MQTNAEQNCPQCGVLIEGVSKRIIKDSCGHTKCRLCLVMDVEGCRQCLENNNINSNTEIEVSSTRNSPRANYKTVITYSNIHNHKKKEVLETKQPELLPKSEQDSSILECIQENNYDELKTNCDKKSMRKKVKTVLNKRHYNKISMPSHISIEGEPPRFLCSICKSTFKTRSHIKYHRFCLGEKKPFECTFCSKTYILKSQLQIHQLIHSGTNPYTCKTCKKSFKEPGKLKRHMVLHSNEKPNICDECGKQFKTISSLKLHRIIHTGEKPFKCKYCKLDFNNYSNMKKHMVTHSDAKTHMCEQCGRKYKLKAALSVHRKSHLPQRNFICKVCNKDFVNKKELKRHETIHSDIKMFSCGLCSVSSRRKDNLQRHIRNAHPDERTEIIEKHINTFENKEKTVVDNPNAINVITASPIARKTEKCDNKAISTARTCRNAPLKLAFKTFEFRKNYNINGFRDSTFNINSDNKSSLIQDTSSNMDISQLTDNVQNNQPATLFPNIYSTQNISVDEFYANRPHVIKNIKFKIPQSYSSHNEELLKTKIPQLEDEDSEKNSKTATVAATSVIVNSSTHKKNHWWNRYSKNNFEP